MRYKKTLSFLGIGLIGLGVYWTRRLLIGRILRLHRPRYGVVVERKIRLPMTDGTNLYLDHYTPKGERLYPTILIRSPYGRGGPVGPTGLLHDFAAQRFAERGYNVLIQDVRGCFDSEGEFEPFKHEAADGKATLEWIENQSWFNGVLGMWGPSYLGYVQWAVAGSAPLYLKAVLPITTGSNLPFSGYRDGALTMDTILRWIVQLDALDRKRYLANWFGLRRMRPRVMEQDIIKAAMHLPLVDIDRQLVGKEVPFLREWIDHLDMDEAYWSQFDHRHELSQVTASAHLISGWYDILLRELLEDYELLKANGRMPYLTIGPWHHLDPECLSEGIRQGLVWFDMHLKGERRELRADPVRIYIMGGGGWREMASWPPAAQEVRYYLHSQDGETGQLSRELPVDGGASVSYIYDPETPTPSLGGPVMSFHAGPVDNHDLEERPDVVTYTTPPLKEDVEVVGPVRLKLYVRSSLGHTDFFGRLCDVNPDGESININDGLIRLKPGQGIQQADGSLLVEIDMWSTANRFQAGHKIRLLVSSGAHPRWLRNLGTDESPVTATKLVPAQQTIYHDASHPSALVLPVI